MPSDKRRRRPPARKGAPDVQQHSQPANNEKRRVTQAAADLVADARFQRRVQNLDRFGSRVLGELLAQLAVQHDCRGEIERFLDRIVENEAAIRTFGFDQWPPPPLRLVPR